MKISVVANGFQEDYTINLINALAKQSATIDFIGLKKKQFKSKPQCMVQQSSGKSMYYI